MMDLRELFIAEMKRAGGGGIFRIRALRAFDKAVQAAAPDSREEWKTRLELELRALHYQEPTGCSTSFEASLPEASYKVIVDVVMRLLPALKAEGGNLLLAEMADYLRDYACDAHLLRASNSANQCWGVAYLDCKFPACKRSRELREKALSVSAPPVAAQVDEAEVREFVEKWNSESVLPLDIQYATALLRDFARSQQSATHGEYQSGGDGGVVSTGTPGNQLAPSGQLETKLRALADEWEAIPNRVVCKKDHIHHEGCVVRRNYSEELRAALSVSGIRSHEEQDNRAVNAEPQAAADTGSGEEGK